jgi:hypothetical protein
MSCPRSCRAVTATRVGSPRVWIGANIEAVIWDPFWNTGQWHTEDVRLLPSFRIDSCLVAFHPDASDHDTNNIVRDWAPHSEIDVTRLADVEDLIERLLTENVGAGGRLTPLDVENTMAALLARSLSPTRGPIPSDNPPTALTTPNGTGLVSYENGATNTSSCRFGTSGDEGAPGRASCEERRESVLICWVAQPRLSLLV